MYNQENTTSADYVAMPQDNIFEQKQFVTPAGYGVGDIQEQTSYDQSNSNDSVSPALYDHINYVRTKYIQFPLIYFKRPTQIDQPDHPNFYDFKVQANLPFRIDPLFIEQYFDASQSDIYTRCFLEPIAQENQFQGWSESRLVNHPFMQTIQELCGQLSDNVMMTIYAAYAVLALLQIFNITMFSVLMKSEDSGFLKFLTFALFMGDLSLFIMMGLQITRILRGFGSVQKLLLFFVGNLAILFFYIPIIFSQDPSKGFLPFLMGGFEIAALFGFLTVNKKQINATSQLYLLINGKIKLYV